MHADDIRLIFYLPNLRNYQDRAHLVGQIARLVGKAFLVTSRLDMEPEEIGIDSKLEVVELPKGVRFPGRTPFAASRVVEELIKKNNINVVHDTFCHLLPLFFRRHRFPASVFITSQYILSEWDFRHFFLPRYGTRSFKYRDLRLWMLRIPLQRITFSLADCILLQAPGLIDRLVRYTSIPRAKVAWLPNSIAGPFNFWEPKSVLKDRDTTLRFLIAGSFGVGRGADRLLDLLDLARKRNIPFEVNVLGTIAAIDAAHLQKRIDDLNLANFITFHGRVERDMVNDFYHNSDWLFHLSSVDGSPRVVLEALSRGLPVIGSQHPGIKVLDPEGRYIFFADTEPLNDILDELLKYKNDPEKYKKRSELGKSYVQTHFSSEIISKRYVELYIHLLDNSLRS